MNTQNAFPRQGDKEKQQQKTHSQFIHAFDMLGTKTKQIDGIRFVKVEMFYVN